MNPNWKPLEKLLGRRQCAGFMFMGRINGINLYKHGIARSYLNLDEQGQCYLWRGSLGFEEADFATELWKLKSALAVLGETLETVYDESYIERKRQALETAGIQMERIEIYAEDLPVN